MKDINEKVHIGPWVSFFKWMFIIFVIINAFIFIMGWILSDLTAESNFWSNSLFLKSILIISVFVVVFFVAFFPLRNLAIRCDAIMKLENYSILDVLVIALWVSLGVGLPFLMVFIFERWGARGYVIDTVLFVNLVTLIFCMMPRVCIALEHRVSGHFEDSGPQGSRSEP